MSREESAAKWDEFKAVVNDGCLEWEFSDLSTEVTFLDMTVRISPDGRLKTSLFEKNMALYLFIPPCSAHPPGVNIGHIMGQILRIFRLNSEEEDTEQDVLRFLRRFLNRGFDITYLKQAFKKAIKNARSFLAKSKATREREKAAKLRSACRRLYLHLEYHPQNPTPANIQTVFSETML